MKLKEKILSTYKAIFFNNDGDKSGITCLLFWESEQLGFGNGKCMALHYPPVIFIYHQPRDMVKIKTYRIS